jgi:hypothetical protein
MTKFEEWCEPLFDVDTPRVTKVVEQAATLEEYAAFTLRIMRRAELGKPCPEVDDDGTVLASDEDIIREVVNALAACRRYFWSAKHEWAKTTAKLAAAAGKTPAPGSVAPGATPMGPPSGPVLSPGAAPTKPDTPTPGSPGTTPPTR